MGTLQNMGTLRFAHPTNVPIHGGMMSGRYKAYAEYKDSGVEWLGVIPTHWIVSKIKFIAPYQVGWTPPTKDDANFEGENLWANISDLRGKVIFDTAKKISDEAAKAASMDITPMGSLLYSFKLSVGAVSFAGKDMYTNEAIASFLEGATLPLSYLYYVLPKFVIENASTNIYGARILNQELISNAMMLAPTSLEAEKIANFLDHETAKIDALIDKQQQLIKLLKEKRQAVISHAVTKGLNPAASMRDSGVEWLGVVPAHWTLLPLKRAIELQRGHDLPSDLRVEGEYPIVSSGGVISSHNELKAKSPGIVTGRYGTIGEFYLIEQDYWPLNTSLYSVNTYKNIVKYLWYMLQSMKHLFVVNSMKSAVPGVDRNDLHPQLIALPSDLREQQEIIRFLDQQLEKIALIESKAINAIGLMQERRTALISAAVTGKIDVRNWQAPASFRNHQEAAA
jgi:type I restriction enzyme S subunit